MRPKSFGVGLILGLASFAAAWWSWRILEDRQCRARLEMARREMEAGRFGTARVALQDVLTRRPSWHEATYELGVCELALGRIRAALDAWERIPEDSPETGWIEVRRSRIAMDRGRWSECESLLRSAAARPGRHRAEARWGLVLLLRQEGRLAEARRWLEDGFDVMTDPVVTLGRLYHLDTDPYPIEGVRRALGRAGDQSPDDDRVWLGKAHLATRLGHFDAASAWLRRCLSCRPDDVPVWRMKLDWALAADRPAEAREALPHLPADLEPQGWAASLRAWFAARRGDFEGERRGLRELLADNPADAEALERLAEIALEAGQRNEAESLRRQKAGLDQIRKDYVRMLSTPRPVEHATELAALADRLGRRFDARRWATLGGASAPPDPAGPEHGPSTGRLPSATLAELVPEAARADDVSSSADRRRPRAEILFTDDAEAAGLRFLRQDAGAVGRPVPPVTMSGGIGLLDVDGDGWLDVYAVQGGGFPPDPASSLPGDRLFRNRADGTFEDITERSGIAAMPRAYGHGVAVGDYDNDGRPDLFLTRWRSYALYRNRGDGTFEDVTRAAGLDGDRDWPTSATFADLDNDGDLDLYVCHYLRWDERDRRTCSGPDDPTIYHCSPLDFPALPDHVFRNEGGRFVDISREAGLDDRDGRGLGVLAADLDDDGRVELFVANDMTANYLFKIRGGIILEETGLSSGVAGNASGGYQAGMGVTCGDLDGDGRPDLGVTNFFNESTTYFRNLGHGSFGDHSAAIGLAGPSRYVLGFGIAMLDVDRDGWLDLMTANGHIFDGRPQYPWKMPVQLYRNEGGPRPKLSEVSADAGAPFQVDRMGRGLAAGDLDNDGRIDALVVSQNDPLAYFHNGTEGGHYLTLRLEGTRSNRDAVGARVTVRSGGRARVSQRIGGGSYQSAADPRLHFGLGESTAIDEVEVRWPSGAVDKFTGLTADRGYLLREGEAKARPLTGWKGSTRGSPRPHGEVDRIASGRSGADGDGATMQATRRGNLVNARE